MYFTDEELACNCCGTYNMENYHRSALEVLRSACNFALNPSSGCRCEKHNKNVGGVPTSRHECTSKRADATDLQPNFKDDIEEFINDLSLLYDIARDMRVFTEVIFYINTQNMTKSFVHVSTFPDKPVKCHKIVII